MWKCTGCGYKGPTKIGVLAHVGKKHPVTKDDLIEEYPSLGWGEREWGLLFTARPDVLDHILTDVIAGRATMRRRKGSIYE